LAIPIIFSSSFTQGQESTGKNKKKQANRAQIKSWKIKGVHVNTNKSEEK
jgi:hypothetical protein